MLFDSHSHYTDSKFDEDRDEVLRSLPENGIGTIVACPSTPEEAERCRVLSEKYPFVYFAAGLHPHECGDYQEDAVETIRALSRDPKCVAIGEAGLDYHYDFSPRQTQREWFTRMCSLSKEENKPVIVHDREAHADVLAILQEVRPFGVIHSYSGSAEMAPELLKLGFYISFSGSVTFKNAAKVAAAAAVVPADRLLVETDCPYLAPEPVRGRRNDSRNLQYTAKKIAALRGVSYEEIVRVTEENAKKLFGIG